MTALVRWLAVFLTLAVAPARAQEAIPPADAGAIQQVIQAQLDAFQHDDWQRAFGYASPGIQAKFGNPDVFSQMVRGGYPMVYRPKTIEFRELSATQYGPTQRVFVVGPDGHAYMAYYTMERQPDGTWRIDGCYLVAFEDQSV
ncbi:MAG TPA: DUF4864 domain-containing protein [Dongiaceae bacterium]|nr:DUF4864 domain-containing protein [Dongiaceae bacterium]